MSTDTAPDLGIDDPAERRRVEAIEAGLKAEGQPTHTRQQIDYFGTDEVHRTFLSDGVSFIEHKTMTEGDRRAYLNAVNRDVRLQKASGDAIVRSAPGDERRIMFEMAVTGWNLVANGSPVPFPPVVHKSDRSKVSAVLEKLPPKVLDPVEKDIRFNNMWLLGELSLEQVDQQIEELEQTRERLIEEREAKKA